MKMQYIIHRGYPGKVIMESDWNNNNNSNNKSINECAGRHLRAATQHGHSNSDNKSKEEGKDQE